MQSRTRRRASFRTLPRSIGDVTALTRSILIALTIAVVGCGPAESDYFPTSGVTRVGAPALAGEPVYFGIELLNAEPGDVVRLEGLEVDAATGGASVEGLVAFLGEKKEWIGSGTGADLVAAGIDASTYRPVSGTEFKAADGPLALAVRMTGSASTFGFDSVRLLFRVNGGPTVRERFHVGAIACAAADRDKARQICDVLEQPRGSNADQGPLEDVMARPARLELTTFRSAT